MRKFTSMLLAVALICSAITMVGCNQTSNSHTPKSTSDTDVKGESNAQADYTAALAGLSDADRALAEKQKTCPVSGEPLGSMGKPYKVTVDGKTVFLCCSGCEAEFKKNPEKYLAKLPK